MPTEIIVLFKRRSPLERQSLQHTHGNYSGATRLPGCSPDGGDYGVVPTARKICWWSSSWPRCYCIGPQTPPSPPPPPPRTLPVLSNAQHRPRDGRSNRSCNCLAGGPVLARGTLDDKPATAQHSPAASFEGELTAAHNDTGPTPNTAIVIRPNPGLHHTTGTLSNSTVSTSRCPQRDASRVVVHTLQFAYPALKGIPGNEASRVLFMGTEGKW